MKSCNKCKNLFSPIRDWHSVCSSCYSENSESSKPKTVSLDIRMETPRDFDHDGYHAQHDRFERLVHNVTGEHIKIIEYGRICDGCMKSISTTQTGVDFKCQKCGTRFDLCLECQEKGMNKTECPEEWGCKVKPQLIEKYGSIF